MTLVATIDLTDNPGEITLWGQPGEDHPDHVGGRDGVEAQCVPMLTWMHQHSAQQGWVLIQPKPRAER